MQNYTNKRDLILDSMQALLIESPTQSISVSDIAKKAGIGKGSIYYYFKSKDEIIEAVIERAYSAVIEKSKALIQTQSIDAFTKMEIIFQTCCESSLELRRQESNSFFEIQQSSFLHQKYIGIMIKNLRPILADNICQGIQEGSIVCDYPEQIAELVLIILTIKIDNYILASSPEEIQLSLDAFAAILEKGMGIEKGRLSFLRYFPEE